MLCLTLQSARAESFPSPPPYSLAGLEKYAHGGSCQIVGRALVDTKTFGPLVFSGQKVDILPLTDYNVWYVKLLADLSDSNRHLNYPNELVQFNHSVESDSEGNFSFNNIACGSYLVYMFTDYESDSHRIENRTVYSTNDDEFPTSITTQRIRTKLHRELDVVAAQGTFTREGEQLTLSTFGILGFQQCCGGEI
jgi:hypothetical protein